jgi:hypothetical protein
MNPTINLLTGVKRAAGISSDYALAKALRVSQQRISNYMVGRSEIADDDLIIRAAVLAGVDPYEQLAEFHRAQSKSAYMARFWTGFANMARATNLAGKTPGVTGFPVRMVAEDGIEPPTRGFSIPCSTN